MHLFFSTPIWTSKIKDFTKVNDAIYSYILSKKNSNPKGIKRSNFSGWHSEDFNLNDEDPKKFINSLMQSINVTLKDMDWDLESQDVKITNMWSIINKKDSFNDRHHHGNSDLSAAYYVSADEVSGDIVFYDPRQAFTFSHPQSSEINNLNAQVKSVTPKSGTLVLFPSYLDHSVNPSKSSKDRIVISFNVSLISKRFLK